MESENSEVKSLELERKLQKKLDEVYDLMNQSAKVLRNKNELEEIESKLAPIHIHLDKRYKKKYLSDHEE